MRQWTFRGQLVAQGTDGMDYTTYVFRNLEETDRDDRYVMCVKFPNWGQGYIPTGSTGFVKVRYVHAGTDVWMDDTVPVAYRNTDVHFLKFVPESEDAIIITDDKDDE